MNLKISVDEECFSEKEKTFLTFGNLEVSSFKYETGVCALRFKNNIGYFVALPFKGQMIWDAFFNNRLLTMKSTFKEPRNVESFEDSFGCFMMHCGALRTGNPGLEDDHPPHGELPYANYEQSEIICGNDEKGNYIGLAGSYTYNKAFGDYYCAHPLVKMYEKSSLLNISIKIDNLANKPMELMYMCHVNFRPVDFGRIVQTADWSSKSMKIRTDIPPLRRDIQVKAQTKEYMTLISKLADDPKTTNAFKPEDIYKDFYDPEIVFFINSPVTDTEGWAHFMQIHPDGSADYVSYKPRELDHCARWIVRTKDQEALGLALPSTCDPEGYSAEKKKGNIKEIPPKGSFSASVVAGYLGKEEAYDKERQIEKMMSRDQK
jgi:hypothetical protein